MAELVRQAYLRRWIENENGDLARYIVAWIFHVVNILHSRTRIRRTRVATEALWTRTQISIVLRYLF